MAKVGTVKAPPDKIKPLDELAEVVHSLKSEGHTVVHCHGVFDLLHVGHVRHFSQAKKFGDVLIVTVTPDIYVNKGPHRPIFGENLRAEAVAAQECVDFVAINRWPTATETITLLRPDFYVKGSEYNEASRDRTGAISQEELAARSVGGQLAFTNDITFSSSNLINQHLQVFPPDVSNYLRDFSTRFSADEIFRYLDGARSLKVLVIGEAIIDEYQYCQAIGKSSKEPVLVAKAESCERFAGGILAIANHVANFSDHVSLVTFLGAVNSQESFIDEKLNRSVERFYLYKKDSPTIVKRRFIDSYFFTRLLEVDEMNDTELEGSDNEKLCNILLEQLPRHDVVIVADYGHGMLNRKAIDILCRQSQLLALNVQANAGNLGYHTVSSYPRADYISIDEPELRLEGRDRRGDIKAMVLDVKQRLGCRQIAITRGKRGCLCYRDDQGLLEVPAFAGQVVDRMGAGDAFLSLTSLCVAQNAPMEIVGFIGNTAGALAVATVGHRKSIERLPLVRYIESLLK